MGSYIFVTCHVSSKVIYIRLVTRFTTQKTNNEKNNRKRITKYLPEIYNNRRKPETTEVCTDYKRRLNTETEKSEMNTK